MRDAVVPPALLIAMTIALVSVPAGQAVGPAPDDVVGLEDVAERCRTEPVEPVDPVRPPAAIEDRLQTLHDRFADLDGFVDVYHVPSEGPDFRATFVGSVPAAAHDRALASDVGFATIPDAPQPAVRDAPVSVPSQEDIHCQGIRPGAWADGCTANFVYRNDTSLFIGSAGHCFSDGETVRIGNRSNAGVVVFRMAGGIGRDFALIEIHDIFEDEVSAEMCAVGGPVDGHQGSLLGRPMVSNGHGRGVGFPFDHILPPRPRAGAGISWGAQSFTWSSSMMGGDSGNPVATRSPSEAVGTHTHSLPGPDALAWGTRWDYGIERAENALGTELTLVTNSTVHLAP